MLDTRLFYYLILNSKPPHAAHNYAYYLVWTNYLLKVLQIAYGFL